MKNKEFKQTIILYLVIMGLIVATCLIGKALGIPEFMGV